MYVSHMENYPNDELQSSNFIAFQKLDKNQKDYNLENFFFTRSMYRYTCANENHDGRFTGTGVSSLYLGVYFVAKYPFNEMLARRWSTTVVITDFVRYGKLYAIHTTLAQLGMKVFVCLICLDLFGHSNPNHYHSTTGRLLGSTVRVTTNVAFNPGEYQDPIFLRDFNIMLVRIHGTDNLDVLGLKYETGLKNRYLADRLGDNTLVRYGCSFSTITGATFLYINHLRKLAVYRDLHYRVTANVGFNRTTFRRVVVMYEEKARIQ